MKINWFTFIAQVINFLVLMWLLKRYLYKPILNAIDKRENKIRNELKDAENTKKNAEKEQAEFQKKNAAFDKHKNEMMEKMLADVDEEKQKLNHKIRKEANDLKEQLEKDLAEAQESKEREITQKVTGEALAIARKILSDISSTGLEEQTVNTFIQKIRGLSEDEKKNLISALRSNSESIQVLSAFQLSSGQQDFITDSLSKELNTPKGQFEFGTAPDLISGIELSANGYKLSWNLSEYIRELKKHYRET
ncbi:MAG: F0F1 ATP synthase subunit B [Cyclobacteriaceae bacterium]